MARHVVEGGDEELEPALERRIELVPTRPDIRFLANEEEISLGRQAAVDDLRSDAQRWTEETPVWRQAYGGWHGTPA